MERSGERSQCCTGVGRLTTEMTSGCVDDKVCHTYVDRSLRHSAQVIGRLSLPFNTGQQM